VALTTEQTDVLLRPLNPSRVSKRSQGGQSLSYLEAWDVKAHLIRIFGFGGWSAEVIESSLAFEEEVKTRSGSDAWSVGYKVTMRLTVFGVAQTVDVRGRRDRDAVYTEAAVGSAVLPSRGDAHDMAVKTAESDALKRCAINLGDQFGLGLYDGGSTRAAVRAVINHTPEVVVIEEVESA
jgi:recombination DNA repair RAD52 pathway protein